MPSTYTLPVGSEARGRLALVDRIYGSKSRALLRRAGIRPGMRVVELGCGTGTMTGWLVEQVGSEGEVVAVDASSAQLDQARAEAPSATFVQALAHQTGLPEARFDLVYSRLLLKHVPDPHAVLAHASALLVDNGTLVCEDITIDSTFCEPPVPVQRQLHHIATDLGVRRGADFNIGRRLYHHVRAVGLTAIEISCYQPLYGDGPEKRMEELSFREVIPAVVALGGHSAEELHAICDELRAAAQDTGVLYGLSAMTQILAKRPPLPGDGWTREGTRTGSLG